MASLDSMRIDNLQDLVKSQQDHISALEARVTDLLTRGVVNVEEVVAAENAELRERVTSLLYRVGELEEDKLGLTLRLTEEAGL